MATPKSRAPVRPVASREPAEDTSLSPAVEILFGTEENPLKLRDGREIVVKKGKVAHVGLLLDFFNALVQNMSRDDIVTLVALIEERRQKEAAGTSTEVPTIEELVEKAFARSSLLVSLFHATVSTLPAIVSALTPLSKDEWQELDMDEGCVVAVTVFQVNYAFFSQNLPHAMKAFLGLAAQKLAAR